MKKNIILALDILKNWSSYHFGWPDPIPVGYVIISMTYACNAKCVMCNLHKFYRERPDLAGKEIELNKVINALKQSSMIKNIRHIDLTGGEPFIRKNLQNFIRMLFGLPTVDLVTINTNGILSEKIAEDVKSILPAIKSHQRFSLSVSIDGIGSLHDTIRGVPGIFEKVEKTVMLLSKIREKHPQFSLRSNAVIQPLNLRVLNSIRAYWKKHGIAGSFSVIQTPFYTHTNEQNNYYNDIRGFSQQDLSLIKSATPKSRGMNDYLDKGCTRPLHCFAGYSAMCIDPFGTIYPCNFLTGNEAYAMGNIRSSGIDTVWTSQQAKTVRKKVKTCPYTHCWNGCEVDQTLVQFDAFDKTIQSLSGGRLSYYRLRKMGEMT